MKEKAAQPLMFDVRSLMLEVGNQKSEVGSQRTGGRSRGEVISDRGRCSISDVRAAVVFKLRGHRPDRCRFGAAGSRVRRPGTIYNRSLPA